LHLWRFGGAAFEDLFQQLSVHSLLQLSAKAVIKLAQSGHRVVVQDGMAAAAHAEWFLVKGLLAHDELAVAERGHSHFEAAEARDALAAAGVGGDHEAVVLSSAKCCVCVPAWGLLTSRLQAALLWPSPCIFLLLQRLELWLRFWTQRKIISIRHE
jgi:hypothetical protein